RSLEEFSGQEHLLAKESGLRKAIDNDAVTSMIFWGPPGTGKTTLANIIANMTGCRFISMSAVSVGIKDVKAVIEEARERLKYKGRKTILFLDEIHRFNKAQQDAFLPHLENGTIILIGATTENPSFEINAALLSRMRVFVLKALTTEDIRNILKRAVEKNGGGRKIADDALEFLALMSNGDARFALNTIEFALRLSGSSEKEIDKNTIEEAIQKKAIMYDRNGEEHYNIMSALHKSVRGSDPQAALYWFYRMIEGGEDPLYIARRVIRMASEDIGLADPSALTLCMSAKEAYVMLGKPEGILAIAEAVVYLSLAPKSNRLYTASHSVQDEIRKSGPLPVPMHIRNAPTKLMKELGYSDGYKYDHDYKNGYSGQDHLPNEIAKAVYYTPSQYGYENELLKRVEYLKKLKSAAS
ncbi:MAG: replication-associated recombination protein A, partial [Fibrobacteres bacterium]|nr:replication-associated recombination protein A [Fibrobacterota bacterium]